MKKILGTILIATIILSLLVMGISCSTPSTQTPPTTPTEPASVEEVSPTQTPETPSVEEKSDTEQIIDTVIAFIVANGEGGVGYEYWYGDSEGYLSWREDTKTTSSGIGHKLLILGLLWSCYLHEDDGEITYDFPEIQENLSVFDVVLYQDVLDLGTLIEKNIFRFNLRKTSQTGWRSTLKEDSQIGWWITDVRVIYTDSFMYQEIISR